MVDKNSKVNLCLYASGIIIIALGAYMWLRPDEALSALSLYVGIIMSVTGVAYLLAFLSRSSIFYLPLGLLNLLIGSIFTMGLSVTIETFPIMFAFWSLSVGTLQLSSSFHNKSMHLNWFWLSISGLSSVIFAFLILTYPFMNSATITIFMGAYMIIYGALGLADFRSHRDEEEN